MALRRLCYDLLSTVDEKWVGKEKKSVDVALRKMDESIFKIEIGAGIDNFNLLPNSLSRRLHCTRLHVCVGVFRVNECSKARRARH
jgi:hypothetical protein